MDGLEDDLFGVQSDSDGDLFEGFEADYITMEEEEEVTANLQADPSISLPESDIVLPAGCAGK